MAGAGLIAIVAQYIAFLCSCYMGLAVGICGYMMALADDLQAEASDLNVCNKENLRRKSVTIKKFHEFIEFHVTIKELSCKAQFRLKSKKNNQR